MEFHREIYDRVQSSGDVTRGLTEMRAGQSIFHLGPDRDHDLTVDLPVRFASFAEAEVVLRTGLLDDHLESVADYEPLLAEMQQRDMTMICANPDKVVHVGERLFLAPACLPSALPQSAVRSRWRETLSADLPRSA